MKPLLKHILQWYILLCTYICVHIFLYTCYMFIFKIKVILSKKCFNNWIPNRKKNEPQYSFRSYTKINSKRIIDLNQNTKTIKFLNKNHRKSLWLWDRQRLPNGSQKNIRHIHWLWQISHVNIDKRESWVWGLWELSVLFLQFFM